MTNAEAMAFGLPVVSTLTSCIPEVVEDGVTGILVPWDDSGTLADAIITLLDNPEMARSMGQRGRMRVERNFTWEQTARKLVDCVRKY